MSTTTKYLLAVAASLAAMTTVLVAAPSASADQPFQRCPDDPSAVIPGPAICSFSFETHRFLPAGTRCAFDVTIDFESTGRIEFFDHPPRAVAHTYAEGTAVGNGHTLIRTAHFTETASPIIVFTDHGLLGRYSLPGGRTITVFAGYDQSSDVPPEPEVFHGNPFDGQDAAAFCAALS